MDEDLLDPRINLFPVFAFEADAGAGFENRLDLFQVELLCFVTDGGQSSSCHPLQAHLALESHLPFRLILYWIRLWLESFLISAHTRNPSIPGIIQSRIVNSGRFSPCSMAQAWLPSVATTTSWPHPVSRDSNSRRCMVSSSAIRILIGWESSDHL